MKTYSWRLTVPGMLLLLAACASFSAPPTATPTSPPVSFMIEAPGTYVFYAVLINEDSYHFGSTGCKAVTDVQSSEIAA